MAEHPGNHDATFLEGRGNLPSRVPALLANLADHRLAEALAGAELPEGEWCLRRLDLHLALDPDRPGPALETQWAAAVLQELQQLIRSGSAEVLHFPRISDAVNDMAAGLTTGRTANAWAWRQLLDCSLTRTRNRPVRPGTGPGVSLLRRRRNVPCPPSCPLWRPTAPPGWPACWDGATGPSWPPSLQQPPGRLPQ